MTWFLLLYGIPAAVFWPFSFRWFPWEPSTIMARLLGATTQAMLWPLGLWAWATLDWQRRG